MGISRNIPDVSETQTGQSYVCSLFGGDEPYSVVKQGMAKTNNDERQTNLFSGKPLQRVYSLGEKMPDSTESSKFVRHQANSELGFTRDNESGKFGASEQ